MSYSTSSGSVIEKMVRAARLDISLYEEVEHNLNATPQAFQAVLIVAVASGLGTAVLNLLGRGFGAAIGGFIAAVISALVGWVIWAYVVYFVGTNLFGGTATPGELLRTMGFAQSPGVVLILLAIPCIGLLSVPVALIWSIVCGVVAIRQALDVDTGKAVATAVIAIIPAALIQAIITYLPNRLLGV